MATTGIGPSSNRETAATYAGRNTHLADLVQRDGVDSLGRSLQLGLHQVLQSPRFDPVASDLQPRPGLHDQLAGQPDRLEADQLRTQRARGDGGRVSRVT